jgi:hypothetical protein
MLLQSASCIHLIRTMRKSLPYSSWSTYVLVCSSPLGLTASCCTTGCRDGTLPSSVDCFHSTSSSSIYIYYKQYAGYFIKLETVDKRSSARLPSTYARSAACSIYVVIAVNILYSPAGKEACAEALADNAAARTDVLWCAQSGVAAACVYLCTALRHCSVLHKIVSTHYCHALHA